MKPISEKKFKYIVIALACIISLFVLASGFVYFESKKKEIRQTKNDELKAIADLKSDQITQWHNERIAELLYFSQSKEIGENLYKYNHQKDRQSLLNLDKIIGLFSSNHDYNNIFILSPDLRILYTYKQDFDSLSLNAKTFFNRLLTEKQKVKTDFNYCNLHNQIHLDFAAKIEINNQLEGILVFRINPDDKLYPLIQQWPIPSKTAESLLVREDGDSVLFLNELRHRKGTAMKFRLPKTQEDLPAARAVAGYSGAYEGVDYRGIKVLSKIRQIEGTNWAMVAKIDKDEIYSDLYKASVINFLLGLFFILSSVFGVFLLFNTRQKNIYRQLLKTQTDLYQSQIEYRTTLHSIGDAVITTNRDGFVEYLNPIAEQLTGWPLRDARNRSIEEVFHIINEETREIAGNPVEKVLKDGLVIGLANHTILISKQNNEIPIADSGAPIRNEKGEISGVVLVFRDQTEERLVEKMTTLRLDLFQYTSNHTLHELLVKSLDEVEILTGSKIGFYHFVLPDQRTLSLQAWSTQTSRDFCTAFGTGLHYDIDKAGVWTECVALKRPLIHNDYETLPNKKGLPEGHAKIIREMVMPVIRNDKIVAIIGVGNKPTEYTDKDLEIFCFLADAIWEMVEQKRSDEKLAESYRTFNTLIDNLNGVVYRCLNDQQWTMQYVSEAIINLTGYPASDFINNFRRNYSSVIFPEDNKIVWNTIQLALSQKQPYTLEYRIINAKGEIKWVWERGRGVFENQELVMLEGFITDISERKNAIAELEYNQELLREMERVANVGGWEFDPATGKGTWTDEVARIHDLTPGDPTNVELGISFYKDESRKKIEHAIAEIIKEGKSYNLELEMISATGMHKWVQTIGKPIYKDGKLIKVRGSFQDITTRKMAELSLKQSEEKLRSIIDNSADAIFIADRNGDYIFVNKQACDLLGYTNDELLSMNISGLADENTLEQHTSLFKSLLETGHGIAELDLRKKDRTYIPVELNAVILPDGMVFGSCRDITERKKNIALIENLNAELEQRVKDRTSQLQDVNNELEAFAYSVSHDLRAPLRGIHGFTQILVDDYGSKLDDEGHRICGVIQGNTRRMGQLIDDILAFSRLSRNQLKISEIDMKSIIEETCQELIPLDKNYDILLNVPSDCSVFADQSMIGQVWRNLIGNAIKFSSTTVAPKIEINCSPGEKEIQFWVKDNGVGFDMQYANKLFGVFQRLHTEKEFPGTGVGLAIVQRIINRHGGKVWAEGETGKGACFYFSLPLVKLT